MRSSGAWFDLQWEDGWLGAVLFAWGAALGSEGVVDGWTEPGPDGLGFVDQGHAHFVRAVGCKDVHSSYILLVVGLKPDPWGDSAQELELRLVAGTRVHAQGAGGQKRAVDLADDLCGGHVGAELALLPDVREWG